MVLVFDGLTSKQFNSRITSRGLNSFLNHELSINSDNKFTATDIFDIKSQIEAKIPIKVLLKLKLHQYIFHIIKKELQKLLETPTYLSHELFIINGEGAIHHNRTTALILIAFGLIAKENFKKVVLINFSIEHMSEKYLKIINQFDLIIPREKQSYRYLAQYIEKQKLFQSYDFAWYYLCNEYKTYQLKWKFNELNPKKILFTKGVGKVSNLENYLYYDMLAVSSIDFALKKTFPTIIDIETLECKDTNDISKLFDLLLNYNLLISGRHHTNIIAMFLGLPILALKSNTSKVSDTIHDLLELKYSTSIPFSNINFIDFIDNNIIDQISFNFKEIALKLKPFIKQAH